MSPENFVQLLELAAPAVAIIGLYLAFPWILAAAGRRDRGVRR